MSLIECVPNVSEGRRADVVTALADAVRAAGGVQVLDISSDADHHRSVLTLAGAASPLKDAVLNLFDSALEHLDIRTHHGVHPRLGIIDVVPFVPLGPTPMADCVALARETARAVAGRFEIPVYLYEEAATLPSRRRLEDIRRGQFESLAGRMQLPEWAPDFGPAAPHPTAGATVIGARRPLVAYNVNLGSGDLDVARRIAATVRERGGGLPFVKAMGVALAHRGIVQVSMNLTNIDVTPIPAVFEAVSREAARHGVAVLESEIIGLIPRAALGGSNPHDLRLSSFDERRILESRVEGLP